MLHTSLLSVAGVSKMMKMRNNVVLDLDLIRLHVIYRYEILELEVNAMNIEEYKVLMNFIGQPFIVSDCQIKKLYRKYCFFRACKMNPRFRHIPSELIYGFFDAKEGSN